MKPADAIHIASPITVADVGTILTYETENTRTLWAEFTGIDVVQPNVMQPRLPGVE